MKHLLRAFDGQNQWWKYVLVLLIGMFGGQMLGSIPLVVVMSINAMKNQGEIATPENAMDLSAFGIDLNLGLVLMIIPFIASLLIGIALVKAFHKRSLMDVINGGQNVKWGRAFSGFILWMVLAGIYLLVDYSQNPQNFEFQFNLSKFLPLVLIAVLLIPFQAGMEEYFMRGYLAQGVASWTKNRILVIIIPALIFALMHAFNPEVKAHGFWITMPQYILFGFFFGLICVLEDGLEMAIGVHAANNIFASLFVTNKDAALQTPALFEQFEVDPARDLVYLILLSVVFIVIMSWRYKWDYKVLLKKVEPEAE